MDYDCRYLNTQFDDYLLMADFKNIQELLDDFKDNVVREAKSNLKTKGNLNNSVKGYVKESKNSIQISFEMEDYGAFVDQGVKVKIAVIKETDKRSHLTSLVQIAVL